MAKKKSKRENVWLGYAEIEFEEILQEGTKAYCP
jgi:hypothetical protein